MTKKDFSKMKRNWYCVGYSSQHTEYYKCSNRAVHKNIYEGYQIASYEETFASYEKRTGKKANYQVRLKKQCDDCYNKLPE